jgi:hypothetical protein
MAKMFVNDAAEFDSTVGATQRPQSAPGFAGLFSAILGRFDRSRQRRIDSEVGEFIESHGGQLTDDLERQISRKFGSQAGQW